MAEMFTIAGGIILAVVVLAFARELLSIAAIVVVAGIAIVVVGTTLIIVATSLPGDASVNAALGTVLILVAGFVPLQYGGSE
jgi:hypothetical protein